MAEKLDLKSLYQSTIPTQKNIFDIYKASKEESTHKNKDLFISATNRTFAMLAHLQVTDFSHQTYSRVLNILDAQDFHRLRTALTLFHIIHNQDGNFIFNKTSVPMIQRYMQIFDAYEKQNGLTNLYAKKSGKEPGDN